MIEYICLGFVLGCIIGGVVFYKLGYKSGCVDQEREFQKSKW